MTLNRGFLQARGGEGVGGDPGMILTWAPYTKQKRKRNMTKI